MNNIIVFDSKYLNVMKKDKSKWHDIIILHAQKYIKYIYASQTYT